jgi:hypothetical protein
MLDIDRPEVRNRILGITNEKIGIIPNLQDKIRSWDVMHKYLQMCTPEIDDLNGDERRFFENYFRRRCHVIEYGEEDAKIQFSDFDHREAYQTIGRNLGNPKYGNILLAIDVGIIKEKIE